MNTNTASSNKSQEQVCRRCGASPADYLYKGKHRYCFTHAPSMAKCQPQGPVVDAMTLPNYALILAEVRADAQKAREAQAKVAVESPDAVVAFLNQPCPEPGPSIEAQTAKLSSDYALGCSPDALGGDPEGAKARARVTDPPTSHGAAKSVNVKGRQLEFMKALAHLPDGQGIFEEVTDWVNHKYGRCEIPSNLSPRCKPLRRKLLVEDTGRKKRSRQGEPNSIWKLTSLGWSLLKTMGVLEDE